MEVNFQGDFFFFFVLIPNLSVFSFDRFCSQERMGYLLIKIIFDNIKKTHIRLLRDPKLLWILTKTKGSLIGGFVYEVCKSASIGSLKTDSPLCF